jgi:nitroreductase
MDVFEAMEKRHSYREGFTPDPVPRAALSKIVTAGIQAPSGYNGQTTSFVIVDDPGLLREMGRIADAKVLSVAPAAIVCVMDPRPTGADRLLCGVEDYSAAVENMLLAVTALGYASVWLDGILRFGKKAALIASLLGVPPEQAVRAILPVGVPLERGKQAGKKPFAERAWFNRYGGAP